MVSVVRQVNTRAAAKASIIKEVFAECSEAVLEAMADLFAQRSTRMSIRDYITGLMADLPRKNCWPLAEHAGYVSPDRLQYLLERAAWDERALPGIVAAQAVNALGYQGVLIFDETGNLKKGRASLGAARQYTGSAGRVENAHVTTWTVWATSAGHALTDYEVYLHKEWFTEGDERLGTANAPDPAPKRTKGQQAAKLLQHLLADAAPPGAVSATGDEVYGNSPRLQVGLYQAQLPLVLACAASTRLRTDPLLPFKRADELAEAIPTRHWQVRAVGKSAKGLREYTWGWLDLDVPEHLCGHHYLLVRQHLATGEQAFCRCWPPTSAILHNLVALARARWAIKESFQQAKGRVGLDEHQVRTWDAPHRHLTLAMTAYLLHTFTTIRLHERLGDEEDLESLSLPETTHLVALLTLTARHTTGSVFTWSVWRRRRSKRARLCHYHRRAHPTP